jgi:hypothetical protein
MAPVIEMRDTEASDGMCEVGVALNKASRDLEEPILSFARQILICAQSSVSVCFEQSVSRRRISRKIRRYLVPPVSSREARGPRTVCDQPLTC